MRSMDSDDEKPSHEILDRACHVRPVTCSLLRELLVRLMNARPCHGRKLVPEQRYDGQFDSFRNGNYI